MAWLPTVINCHLLTQLETSIITTRLLSWWSTFVVFQIAERTWGSDQYACTTYMTTYMYAHRTTTLYIILQNHKNNYISVRTYITTHCKWNTMEFFFHSSIWRSWVCSKMRENVCCYPMVKSFALCMLIVEVNKTKIGCIYCTYAHNCTQFYT